MVVTRRLTAERLAELKTLLMGMQRVVQVRLRLHREELIATERPKPDDGELVNGLEIALIGMRTANLHEIEQALLRIATGTYGRCQCKGSISYHRLKALPTVRTCTTCAEREERKTGRMSRYSGFSAQH